MNLSKISNILDRLEGATVGPWDTIIDTEGRAFLMSPNKEILAENISVGDAWYTSHSGEDIKMLIDEVLDLRRLIFDIHVLVDEKEEHGIIKSYIETVMRDRIG